MANRSTKRKICNLEGNEVSSGGLSKPVIKPAENKLMRMCIHHLHEVFALMYGMGDADMIDIDETMKLTSAIWTCYTVKKQKANDKGSVKDNVKDTTIITVNKKARLFKDLMEAFSTVTVGYGLKFTSTSQEDRDLRGTFQVNLCLIYAFRFRCNEGLYLNNLSKQGELGGVEKAVKVKEWGVTFAHLPFTYGANFPPSMQSALMQQLGLAAIMIELCEARNPDFQGKWVKAAISQLSGVPNIESIAHKCKGKRDENANLVTKVLHIACFGTARQAHKASFPWCMLRKLNHSKQSYLTWLREIKSEVVDGLEVFTYGSKMTETAMDDGVLNMDIIQARACGTCTNGSLRSNSSCV